MSVSINISLLGICAAKIVVGDTNIYIDAFNDYNVIPNLGDKDIVLFTHDDKDHFSAEQLVKSIRNTNLIIGPPSIVFPLWQSGKVSIDQVKVFYPAEYEKHEELTHGNITVKVYNTEHFLDWHNVHISYLLEIEGKRIYFTGDSKIHAENEKDFYGIDCIIYSLLQYEIVKGQIDKTYGKYFHLCELLGVIKNVNPKLIIGNHLINCDWAVDPNELKELLFSQGMGNVVIPISPLETVII